MGFPVGLFVGCGGLVVQSGQSFDPGLVPIQYNVFDFVFPSS